jgi:OOP family OmpA-OmpF porin
MRGLAPRTAVFLPILLAACQPPHDDASEAATAEATESEAPPAPKSIIRAEVSPEPTEAPLIAPEQITVPFPAKGYRPDAAGFAVVDRLLAGPAFQTGGPITIWGHSDSRGSDRDNIASSRRRAETIARYLEHKGIPAKRITVIALGEARPIAPNRKLDGSDDPEGRAKNRRVDIRIDLPTVPPQAP